MTGNVKMVIGFTVGLLSGFAAGKLYFEKKYQKKYEEDIAQMEDYYGKTDEYARTSDVNPNESEPVESDVSADHGGAISKEDVKRHKQERGEKVDYAGAYQKANSEKSQGDILDEKIAEAPKIAAEEAASEEEPVDEYGNDHRKNMNRPPRIVSESALGDIPPYYEYESLTYYTEDDVLVEDDSNEPLDDYYLFVGDCLEKYDFKNSDESLIFVQNFAFDKIYEIQKVNGYFNNEA